MKLPFLLALLALLSTLNPQLAAAPLGTAITYQGQLTDGTNPADGRFDFTFTLYDELVGGRVIAGPLTNSRLNVVDGLFTVTLDFRADVFGSQARWLGLAVRSSGLSPFIPLSPRQPLTPTPQAFYASNAGDAALLNGQSGTSYVAKAGDTMTGPLIVPANGFRAGTDQLVLTGDNVGIGTTSPGALLGLLGDVGGDQTLVHARGSHTAGAWLSLENTSTDGKRWDFISTGAGNGGGAGNLLFRHAAVGSVLTLTPQGRAGVGTLGPIAKLDVVDEAGTDTLIRAESSRTAGSTLALVNTDTGGTRWDVISTGSGNSGGAGKLLFREAVAGGAALTVTPAGRVGVGTLSPLSRLHVVGETGMGSVLVQAEGPHPAGSWFTLESTDAGGKRWDFISTGSGNNGGAGNLVFRQDAVGHVMSLSSLGRVGIGTDTPAHKLDVVGEPGASTILIRAKGSSTLGSELLLENTDTGGKRWHVVSSGSGTFGGPGKLIVLQGSDYPVLTLDGNQQAGINNVAPEATLDIVSKADQTTLKLQNLYGWSQIAMQCSGGQQGLINLRPDAGLPLIEFSVGDNRLWLGPNNAGTHNLLECSSLVETSDRNRKAGLEEADPKDILGRLLSLPISTWSFTNALHTRHIGPMAQDFHATFGFGDDDKTIGPRDANGVALAAIQGLNQKVEDRSQESEARSQKLEARNAVLEKEVAELKALVQSLAAKVNGGGQ